MEETLAVKRSVSMFVVLVSCLLLIELVLFCLFKSFCAGREIYIHIPLGAAVAPFFPVYGQSCAGTSIRFWCPYLCGVFDA